MNYYAEPDHEPDEEIEDPEVDDHMDPGIRIKPQQRREDDFDEPIQQSFYERYGFDERDGPPEEEEYFDDPPVGHRW